MVKLKGRKIFVMVGIAVMVLAGALATSNRQYVKTAWAEDGEEDKQEEDDDKEDDEAPVRVINTDPSSNTKQITEYVTVYKKLSDTITTKTDTITRHDSDGDGLYDDEDAHPTINEYFIVKDDDLNGIDDRYEPEA